MVELSHDLYFLDDWLFASIFAVSCFLWERFNSIVSSVFIFHDKVHWSKASFTNLSDRMEEFMESSLVEFFFKLLSPLIEILLTWRILEIEGALPELKLDSGGHWQISFWLSFGLLNNNLKDQLKAQFKFKIDLFVRFLNKDGAYLNLDDQHFLKQVNNGLRIFLIFIIKVEFGLKNSVLL